MPSNIVLTAAPSGAAVRPVHDPQVTIWPRRSPPDQTAPTFANQVSSRSMSPAGLPVRLSVGHPDMVWVTPSAAKSTLCHCAIGGP
jgi:hypothetical protein